MKRDDHDPGFLADEQVLLALHNMHQPDWAAQARQVRYLALPAQSADATGAVLSSVCVQQPLHSLPSLSDRYPSSPSLPKVARLYLEGSVAMAVPHLGCSREDSVEVAFSA
eukprot:286867-Amphidinium_carterae.1